MKIYDKPNYVLSILPIPPGKSLDLTKNSVIESMGIIEDLSLSSDIVPTQHTEMPKRERIEVTGVVGSTIDVAVDGIPVGSVLPDTPLTSSVLTGDKVTLSNNTSSPCVYYCCTLRSDSKPVRPASFDKHLVPKGSSFTFLPGHEYVVCVGGGEAKSVNLKMGNYIPNPSTTVEFVASVDTCIADFTREVV